MIESLQFFDDQIRKFSQSDFSIGHSTSNIDAFCGRTPRSVLAGHYTDYSPNKLMKIYKRANLKVLS